MDDLLSEKEQIDQFRSWWKEYGAFVIGGIVIGVGILVGINYYQSSKLQAQVDASVAYESLVENLVDGDLEGAETLAEKIATDYPNTTYVGQSGLAMARLYMDKNRDQDAADALLAVVDGNADDGIKQIARLRLARIYIYQDKAQEVVDLLSGKASSAFEAAFNEVLGDAFTDLGRIAEAEDAYQKALLDPLSQGTVDQQLVQWKALDLPEPEVAEAIDADPANAEIAEPQAADVVESLESISEEDE